MHNLAWEPLLHKLDLLLAASYQGDGTLGDVSVQTGSTSKQLQNLADQAKVLSLRRNEHHQVICIKRDPIPDCRGAQRCEDRLGISHAEHGIERFHDQHEQHGRQRIALAEPRGMANATPWMSIEQDFCACRGKQDGDPIPPMPHQSSPH